MRLNTKTCVALVAFQCVAAAFAGGEGWTSDFAAAKKQAADSKKDLLVDFTGSDWCSWCIKLDKEVFSQDAFKTGVKDKFVLVEVDFPKDPTILKAQTLKQNEELGKKYDIKGYPTILLCDADGRPFAATGYREGGADAYVKQLTELREKKKVRDDSFAAAEKATGVEKAKALEAALKSMELENTLITNFYGDVVEQIKAADPEDETGFAKAEATQTRLTKFNQDLNGFAQKGDFEGALKLVDDSIKDGSFPKDKVQKMMVTRAMIFAQTKKFDEAIKAVEEAKAFAPDSEIAADLDGFKKHLEEGKAKAEAKPADDNDSKEPAEKK